MANFTLRFGGGIGYALNAPVSSNELNLTGLDLEKCANFVDGSAHAMAADVELTGPGGIKLMGPSRLKYEERSVIRRQPLHGAIFDTGEWAWTTDGILLAQGGTAGSGAWLRLYLTNLPHGAELSYVTVSWDGATGHAGDPVILPPGVLVTPELEVHRVTQAGGTFTLGTQTDTTVVRASYEQSHEITADCGSHVIDLEANAYYIRFRGEYDPSPPGGDFIAGGLFESVKVACKVTDQSEY